MDPAEGLVEKGPLSALPLALIGMPARDWTLRWTGCQPTKCYAVRVIN